MRMLMKVGIPVDAGNTAIRNGSLPVTLKSILDDLKPECAYFAEENGQRTGFIIVNIKDESEIPRIAEPFFLALNASVQLHPAMVIEDLMKAGPHIERAVKEFGHHLVHAHN